MSKDLPKEEMDSDPILKRLDAIIRLIVETNKLKEHEKLSEGNAARHLNSVGLSPTEIARILGKKAATDISYALYPKKEKTVEENKQAGEMPNEPIR